MKCLEFLLRSIKQRGICRIFGVPGRENAHILFNEVEGIEFITARVEFNAGIMAEFTARMTQTPQVAFCTMGPGATNMVTTAASAMLNRSPLLLVSAQLESDDLFYNLTHQCVNQRSIFEPVTKASIELNKAEDLPQVLESAFALMMQKPMGPVHISIPNDFWTQDIGHDDATFKPRTTKVSWAEPASKKSDIQAVYTALLEAAKPLCLVGSEAIRSGVEKDIRSFCQQWKIPLLASANAKGLLDHNDPLNAGSASCYMEGILQYPTALDDLFYDVDIIINIGYQYVDDILPKMWQRGIEKKIIHISSFSAEPIKSKYAPDFEIIGHIGEFFGLLSEFDVQPKTPPNLGRLKDYLERAYQQTSNSSSSMTPVEVIRVINQNLEDGTLVTDIGYYRHHAILFSRPKRINQFFTDAGLSSFGCGLPSAAAAQFIDKSQPVFLLCGDGGFHSGSCDLETLTRHQLPVVTIVMNNSSYELIQRYQQRGGNGNNKEILSFTRVDFVKLAEANGVRGAYAKNVESLDQLVRSRDKLKPLLIEVPLNYHHNDQFKESF